jgi:hypothetical protein
MLTADRLFTESTLRDEREQETVIVPIGVLRLRFVRFAGDDSARMTSAQDPWGLPRVAYFRLDQTPVPGNSLSH